MLCPLHTLLYLAVETAKLLGKVQGMQGIAVLYYTISHSQSWESVLNDLGLITLLCLQLAPAVTLLLACIPATSSRSQQCCKVASMLQDVCCHHPVHNPRHQKPENREGNRCAWFDGRSWITDCIPNRMTHAIVLAIACVSETLSPYRAGRFAHVSLSLSP